MFEIDNTKNNFTITDYNSKYPKYIHVKRTEEEGEKKTSPKTSISLTMPFP